jgi:hypothetical protein
MRAFEHINLLLIFALLVGAPIAATARPPGHAFSVLVALKQGVVFTVIVACLIALNVVVARLVMRVRSSRKV